MAVQEDDHVSKTYYKIHNGRVVREWYKEEPQGVSRVEKRVTPESNKTVWFKNYIFKGILTDTFDKFNDRIDAMQFNIVLDEESVLVVNSGSSYHKSFLLTMANIPNNGEEIEFSPYNFTDRESGRKIVGMNLKLDSLVGDDNKQGKIPSFYTKDDPNGLPQPTSKVKAGKKIWNWTKQEDFLEEAYDAWKEVFFAKVETKDTPDKETEADDMPF